jgi:rare lipoprotein A (peptidoglycan hydrolase)
MRSLLLLPAAVMWAAVCCAPVAPAAAHLSSAPLAGSLAGLRACFAKEKIVLSSWYGRHWRGRRTASGGRFDDRLLTAASRTIPLLTFAKVRNLVTGALVRVQITDRGPYVAGRGLDLSERAARLLGVTKRGIEMVSIEIEEAAQ